MNGTPSLVRYLRAVFGFIRGLTIFWLVVLPIFFIGDWHNRSRWTPDLGEIGFDPASVSLRTSANPGAQPIDGVKLREVRGTLLVVDTGDGAKLMAAMRTPVFVTRMARTLTLFFIAHLLWRLCQTVERGEVFSPGNSRLVRLLGFALVARPLVALVTETWQRASVARYVEEHIWFEGIRPIPSLPALGPTEAAVRNLLYHGDFDFSLFVTGLLVLALAEVFRRGLVLKQESDLTV